MPAPRGIEDRIRWFQNHSPSKSGMCAQHTWRSLGGDYGNPPAWGAPTANSCVDKIKASGRYWTPQTWSGPPPRGAWIGWKYGDSGHAAIGNGNDWKINTTDPSGNQGMCGVEPLDFPRRWGFNTANGPYTLWTDQYNGVRFEVGANMSGNYDYDYLDKPSGNFTVTRDYKTLDNSTWNPPRTGWENTFVYLNIKPFFQSGKNVGAIRIRVYREDGDTTGHHDLVIHKDALDTEGKTLRHWIYWEAGGKGDSTKVQMQCIGGLASAVIGTRYTKKAVVVD
jgi:hypothetical protein